jgi:subtilisin family serine protease
MAKVARTGAISPEDRLMRRTIHAAGLTLALVIAGCQVDQSPTSPDLAPTPQLARTDRQEAVAINVLLNRPATAAIRTELASFGTIRGEIQAINAVFLVAPRADIAAIRALPHVAAAGADAERSAGPPVPPVAVTDFASGLNTWDLDAVDVTNFGAGRTVAADGTGVYVGVLDTGLLESWPFYFPDERIAEEYARSYTGGGALSAGNVATQPNKWERDVVSHGTHVTSTIIGYNLRGTRINGVAPKAIVIPVKVLNNGGGGWSSAIAEGIVYVTDLKDDALGGAPVVINMSLGGPVLDAVEKAAIDYAVAHGVIVVASAGNAGDRGMGYPGAYEKVISVGATGWKDEWVGGGAWWRARDVVDPTNPDHFYVTDFSSREKTGQDLDVLAPGSWVVGPWQTNQGHTSYFFVGGTSMASPHVAGVAALMVQSDPTLLQADVEAILESTAIPLPAGSRNVLAAPGGPTVTYTWGNDANGSGMVTAPAALAAVGGS